MSGGPTGTARVIDLRRGSVLATYRSTTGPAFINDVVLTRRAAWFTDSQPPVLYRVSLPRRERHRDHASADR